LMLIRNLSFSWDPASDQDPGSQNDPDADPDPQHWFSEGFFEKWSDLVRLCLFYFR
jgi:hypothetical protein